MTCILGVDPGLAHTGYGIVRVQGNKIVHVMHGVITTTPDLPTGKRLDHLYRELTVIVNTFKPSMAGIESLYFMKNIRSALPVAQARGIALLVLEQAGIDVSEFNPQQIKQSIVGSGSAEKSQVQELVKIILSLPEIPEPDHAADALAAAICAFHMKPRILCEILKAHGLNAPGKPDVQ